MKVLARFVNLPEPEYREDTEYPKSDRSHLGFDKSRNQVIPLNLYRTTKIFYQCGISDDTVKTLSPFISLIRDTKHENFDGYNIGFPYTDTNR